MYLSRSNLNKEKRGLEPDLASRKHKLIVIFWYILFRVVKQLKENIFKTESHLQNEIRNTFFFKWPKFLCVCTLSNKWMTSSSEEWEKHSAYAEAVWI